MLLSKKTSLYGTNRISIGDNTRIDDFCILSGNIAVGSNVHISASTLLYGGENGIEVQDFSSISSRCAIYADTDDYTGEAMANPTIPDEYRKITGGKVVLERHVLIGTGCTVLPAITIGEGISIGSMSLVTKDLEPWGMYVGIPCKRIKERNRKILELEKELKMSSQ